MIVAKLAVAAVVVTGVVVAKKIMDLKEERDFLIEESSKFKSGSLLKKCSFRDLQEVRWEMKRRKAERKAMYEDLFKNTNDHNPT